MRKKDLLFAALVAAVIGVFIYLSLIGRAGRALTPRVEHAGLTTETPRETCWECHAPESAIAPMPARHPKKGKPPDQTTPCSACHKFPDSPVVILESATRRENLYSWLEQQLK